MKPRIYLDYNATTPLDGEVLEAMLPWLREDFGNPSSIHSHGIEARTAVERARRIIARAINAQPDEIVFTSGGTEANNLAIRGFASSAFKRGDRLSLLTSNADHAAVRETVHDVAALFRFEATELPVDPGGRLSPNTLRKHAASGPSLLATLIANNETGAITDVEALHKINAANTHVINHIDAVQALGRIPVDVARWGCDSAAFSAHKLYGPKGAGALFVRSGAHISPLQTGGGQEGRVRPGTENVAGIVGFAAAVRIALERMESEAARLTDLREDLWSRITEHFPTAIRNTPTTHALPGTLNVSFPGHDGRSLVRLLDEKGIAVSAASACSSSGSTVSHVLRAITSDEDRQRGALRISMGRFTVPEDVERLVEALRGVLGPA